jgi:heme/copper-type cytochrome/quinol oxidase subunit 2
MSDRRWTISDRRFAINGLRFSWRWFILAAAGLAIAFVPIPARSAPAQQRVFRVEAHSFAYQPAVLRANPHDRVTIELVSTDVVHGIYLDGYELEVIADPGQTATLSFVADRPGTFRFRCSVTCGALHPFMIGKLQVGRNTLLWRSAGLALLAALAGAWSLRK